MLSVREASETRLGCERGLWRGPQELTVTGPVGGAACVSPWFLNVFQNGADDVKSHRWFRTVNWDDVYARKVEVTFT